MSKLTQARLKELLDYDPLSGLFTRRVRTSNSIKIGDIAGCDDGKGYIRINVDGKLYKAHRLAFLWMMGHWPENDVDHRNEVKSDNRWDNIRTATRQQNNANKGKQSNNTSGYKGVTWNKATGKWQAAVTFNRKRYHLGFYDDPAYAAAVHAGASRLLFGDFNHSINFVTINNYFAQQKEH